MLFHRRRSSKRSQSGVLGAVLLSGIVLIVVGLGALAVDLAHVQTVQGELQNATDPANADADAVSVAGENKADGRAVSSGTGSTVNVTVLPIDSSGDSSVEVDASMTINHMLARIFGRTQDTVISRSTATYYPVINYLDANQFFPIAPSIDDTSQGAALNTKHIGDNVTIVVESGGSGGNAAWVSGTTNSPANTNYMRGLIDIALQLAPPNSSIDTAIAADGVTKISPMSQGMHLGTNILGTQEVSAMMAKPFLVFPVISGSKPYVQSRTVLGFITVKVNSVSQTAGQFTINGTLVKGLVQGLGGALPNAGSADPGGDLSNISAATVKLTPAS